MYDMVPLDAIKLLSTEIISALALRSYQFILVEAGKSTKYINGRICSRCERIASPEDFVPCTTCEHLYHIECLDTIRKPTRGYAWECWSCLKPKLIASGHIDESDSPVVSIVELPALAVDSSPFPSPQRKRIQQMTPLLHPTWPYRYISDGFEVSELDDPWDNGHPRGTSRIGRSYQAEVPDAPSGSESATTRDNNASEEPEEKRGSSGRNRKKKPVAEFVRGTQDEIVFDLPEGADAKTDKFVSRIKAKIPASAIVVDALDCAMRELHNANYDFEKAFTRFCEIPTSEYLTAWTPAEQKRFETSVKKNGGELHAVFKDTRTKRPMEVVKHFYVWKATEPASHIRNISEAVEELAVSSESEWDSSEDEELDPSSTSHSPRSASSSTAPPKSNRELTPPNSERLQHAKPLFLLPTVNRRRSVSASSSHECANCCINASPLWIRGAKAVETNEVGWYCEPCGEYWRKYSYMMPVTETVKRLNRENAELQQAGLEPKKKKIRARKTSEPVQLVAELPKCSICLDNQENHFVKCMCCGLFVHANCYGVLSETQPFTCTWCLNILLQRLPTRCECVLCGKLESSQRTNPMKRTIGNNWVHATCAIWTPNVTFTQMDRMEPVDGVGLIEKQLWKQKCDICLSEKGCCISCSEKGCNTSFHVTCARAEDCDFVIETSGRQSDSFAPKTFCKAHSGKPKQLKTDSTGDTLATPRGGGAPQAQLVQKFVGSKLSEMAEDAGDSERLANSNDLPEVSFCHAPELENGFKKRKHHLLLLSREEDVPKEKVCDKCRRTVSPAWWVIQDVEAQQKVPGGALVVTRELSESRRGWMLYSGGPVPPSPTAGAAAPLEAEGAEAASDTTTSAAAPAPSDLMLDDSSPGEAKFEPDISISLPVPPAPTAEIPEAAIVDRLSTPGDDRAVVKEEEVEVPLRHFELPHENSGPPTLDPFVDQIVNSALLSASGPSSSAFPQIKSEIKHGTVLSSLAQISSADALQNYVDQISSEALPPVTPPYTGGGDFGSLFGEGFAEFDVGGITSNILPPDRSFAPAERPSHLSNEPELVESPIPFTPSAGTPLSERNVKECLNLLKIIKRHPSSWPFLAPVDPVASGAPTYFDVIKNPMDFGTIEQRLALVHYPTVESVLADLQLCLDNCYLFNPPPNSVRTLATHIDKLLEARVPKIWGTLKWRDTTQEDANAPPKPITESEWNDCKSIIGTLLQHPAARPFLEPVDPVALGIPTYTKIVTRPMDFGTVARRVESRYYPTVKAFVADLQLVLDNCFRFNPEQHSVHGLGKQVEKFLENQLMKKWPTVKWRGSTVVSLGSGSGRAAAAAAVVALQHVDASASIVSEMIAKGRHRTNSTGGRKATLQRKMSVESMESFGFPAKPVKKIRLKTGANPAPLHIPVRRASLSKHSASGSSSKANDISDSLALLQQQMDILKGGIGSSSSHKKKRKRGDSGYLTTQLLASAAAATIAGMVAGVKRKQTDEDSSSETGSSSSGSSSSDSSSSESETGAPTMKQLLASFQPKPTAPPPKSYSAPRKECEYCRETSTSTWRRGPSGVGTLCNRCGVKWAKDNRHMFPNSSTSSAPRKRPSKAKSATFIPVSYDQKLQLSTMIDSLSDHHQASVVEMIRTVVPGTGDGGQEIELDIDAFDDVSLRQLFDHVTRCVEDDRKVLTEKQKAAQRVIEELQRNRGE
ncbi:hypothetical protein HDU98_007032 [Podochytrium sp. JEL0797]|nr:hypothetical protein HDU98_007032 [Podochytrium sp. JEL0797]